MHAQRTTVCERPFGRQSIVIGNSPGVPG